MARAPQTTAESNTAIDIDFAAAFASALKDEPLLPKEPDPAPDPAPAGDPPAGDPPAGDPPTDPAGDLEKTVDELAAEAAAANAGGTPPAEGGTPPADPKKPATPAPEPDPVDRLADVLAQRLGQQPPQPQQTTQQPDPTPARQPQAQDFYTPEEREIIAAYEKEWPDVARVEAIKRKGEYGLLVSHVFEQFTAHMRPMAEMLTQLAARAQYSDLKTLEPEYDDLSEKVGDWVEAMPDGLLKNAYATAITQGSASDMQQVFDAYKKATGYTAPAPAAGTQQPAAVKKPVTELPLTTKQAVAALAPVSTKRGAQPALVPETFEDAWELAAKET